MNPPKEKRNLRVMRMMTEFAMERNTVPLLKRVRVSTSERNKYIRERYAKLRKHGMSHHSAIQYIEGLRKISLSDLHIRDIIRGKE